MFHHAVCNTCVFVQGLEENLRETQATAQRLETHLKQKEKLYEDKIKVEFLSTLILTRTQTVCCLVKQQFGMCCAHQGCRRIQVTDGDHKICLSAVWLLTVLVSDFMSVRTEFCEVLRFSQPEAFIFIPLRVILMVKNQNNAALLTVRLTGRALCHVRWSDCSRLCCGCDLQHVVFTFCVLISWLWFCGLPGIEQVLEAQMKADMADKEMLESSQSKYEEEVREKCSIISEQKAVRAEQICSHAARHSLNLCHTDIDLCCEGLS